MPVFGASGYQLKFSTATREEMFKQAGVQERMKILLEDVDFGLMLIEKGICSLQEIEDAHIRIAEILTLVEKL